MIFFDCHAHHLEKQHGGFIIALENDPNSKVFDNNQITSFNSPERKLYSVQYVTKYFQPTDTSIIKYHPQREGYTVQQVNNDMKFRNPKIVIIDTLAEPFWTSSDFWKLCSSNINIQILLAHCGGWNILEFMRIAVIVTNVWIDFSWTQHYFGWCGKSPKLRQISECIEFAYNHKTLKNKILFGSDNPFYSQKEALNKVINLKNSIDILQNNYFNLLEISNI